MRPEAENVTFYRHSTGCHIFSSFGVQLHSFSENKVASDLNQVTMNSYESDS